ncbi:MAG: type 1 glutamine amidotransferase domain-containing protein [Bacteroidota bacterium]
MNKTTVVSLLLLMKTMTMHAQDVSALGKEYLQNTANVLVPTLSTELMMTAGKPQNERLKKLLLEKATNPSEFTGKRIALVATDGYEEIELLTPYNYFKDRGATVTIVAPKYNQTPLHEGSLYPEMRKTHILGVRWMSNQGWIKFDKTLDEVAANDFDALILPGGLANPDKLRLEKKAISLIQEMFKQGKTIAAICHGPQVLINAGILTGKRVTAVESLLADLKNAGGLVEDTAVVVDGNLITSRTPLDLPDFIGAISKRLK